MDWSVYMVLIAGVLMAVHALAVVLAHSRKAFVAFFPDEKLPTFLEGLLAAFLYLGGCTRRVVFDNMATVVLGRIGAGKQPIWNPRFLEFADYLGFEAYLCKVRDPNRKGAIEAFLYFVERDFVRGSEFASLDDMNRRARRWLDEVANRRRHGTTGLVPEEVWRHEREFLIRLPETPFAGARTEELRKVGPDSTLSVRGTAYTVPARLAHSTVTVRLYSGHFEVLDADGAVALSRPYAAGAERGRLQLDPEHYRDLPHSPKGPAGFALRLEEAFLARFPGLADFYAGLRRRMAGFTHVHLRDLLRLADRYGAAAFLEATARAQQARRFNAHAVRRILEREHPLPPDEEPLPSAGALARLEATLRDVDPGSLDDYARLDGKPKQEPKADDEADDREEPSHVA